MTRRPTRLRQVTKTGKQGRRRPKQDYPEAFPAPHPRRPQLIAPIRAEVVQTERVVETPQDPPPNAYYDPAHGILRVYHGPVYGSSFGYPLYPRRDPDNRPLPIGTPHPTQNPYYYGFSQPPQPGQAYYPVNQGMPADHVNAPWPQGAPMAPQYPPNAPWPPPGPAPGHVQNGPPPAQPDVGGQANGNRGAFSMTCANGASPFSKTRDKDGSNNVGPGSVKNLGTSNPYYPNKGRSTGGSRVPSSAGKNNSTHLNGGVSNNDGAGDNTVPIVSDPWQSSSQNGNAASNSNQPADNWGPDGSQNPPTEPGQAASGDGNPGQAPEWNHWSSGQTVIVGNGAGSTKGWDNVTNNSVGPTNVIGGEWSGGASNGAGHNGSAPPALAGEPAKPQEQANNVMPGAFPEHPSWGDPNAAASTNGLVDLPGPWDHERPPQPQMQW
ncbi:hypothetical protein CDD83_3332 [Cordyceps sp. RAO-2017]|nr:hypothetical protein CDD83_3332 [Cordyceps sp. RAO-2017]